MTKICFLGFAVTWEALHYRIYAKKLKICRRCYCPPVHPSVFVQIVICHFWLKKLKKIQRKQIVQTLIISLKMLCKLVSAIVSKFWNTLSCKSVNYSLALVIIFIEIWEASYWIFLISNWANLLSAFQKMCQQYLAYREIRR